MKVYGARLRDNAVVSLGVEYVVGYREININLLYWLICIQWNARRHPEGESDS